MTPVTEIFDCMSGNSGLTEEVIYNKICQNGATYEVLSSSTAGMTKLGFIPKCLLKNNRMLRVFEKKHGILVARNGKAGQMAYLKPSKYTINDHAYILSLKKDFKKLSGIDSAEDEKAFLMWFIGKYQSKVYEFSSKTANATWNKTDFMKMSIVLPKQDEVKRVAKVYEECLGLKNTLEKTLERINDLLSKEIA